mmetsp:Transcript_5259/g.21472  ORF Transcript_5259/g.21472 Transcript_5259/m.21472 type:complete len:393 (+) Transcript_5259:83-1261(+)
MSRSLGARPVRRQTETLGPRQPPQRHHDRHRRETPHPRVHAQRGQRDERRGADAGARRVRLPVRVQYPRRRRAKRVSHDPAERSGEHAARHGDHRVTRRGAQAVVGADDAKPRDGERVQPVQRTLQHIRLARFREQSLDAWPEEKREHRRGEGYVHVLGLTRPEHLLSQHEPAERPAAHRCDRSDDEAPEEVHPRRPRGRDARLRKHGGAEVIDKPDEGAGRGGPVQAVEPAGHERDDGRGQLGGDEPRDGDGGDGGEDHGREIRVADAARRRVVVLVVDALAVSACCRHALAAVVLLGGRGVEGVRGRGVGGYADATTRGRERRRPFARDAEDESASGEGETRAAARRAIVLLGGRHRLDASGASRGGAGREGGRRGGEPAARDRGHRRAV